MREALMEPLSHTLQIKAKVCKCFSTHTFKRQGGTNPDTSAVWSPVNALNLKCALLLQKKGEVGVFQEKRRYEQSIDFEI